MSYIQNPSSSTASPFAQVTWATSTTMTPDTSSQTWCIAGNTSAFTGSGFVSSTIVLTSVGVGSYYLASSTSRYRFGQIFGRSGGSYGQTYPACEPSAIAYDSSTLPSISSSTGSVSVDAAKSRINVMRVST